MQFRSFLSSALALFCLTSCSQIWKDAPPKLSIRLSRGGAAGMIGPRVPGRDPSSLADFGCFLVLASGDKIPEQSPPAQCAPTALTSVEKGQFSPVVALGNEITMGVIAGADRKFDVYGADISAAECNLAATSVKNVAFYSLGSATVNLFQDTTVEIPLSWVTATPTSFLCNAANPGAFSITSATPSNQAVTLVWGASDLAETYTVKWGTTPGVYTGSEENLPSLSYQVTGLDNGTPYYFLVSAKNKAGETLANAEISATPTPPPGAFSISSATAGDKQVTLVWGNSSGATSYIVKYGVIQGNYTTTVAGLPTSPTTVAQLENDTKYFFMVIAKNAAGETNASAEVSSTPNLPPGSFTLSKGVVTSTSVALTWTASNKAAKYEVKHGTSEGVYGAPTETTATSFTVTGLTTSQKYYFMVTAVNDNPVKTDATPEVSATPNPPPGNFTLSAGTVTANSVALSWTASNKAANYEVKYGTVSTEYGAPVSTTDTAYVVSGLSTNTQYFFMVTAVNDNPTKTDATPEISKTPNPAPGAFAFTSGTVTATSVTLNWSASANATKYKVTYGTTSGQYPSEGGETTGTSITVSSLTSGQRYYFMVEAINDNSSIFATAEIFKTPNNLPGAFTLSKGSVGADSVQLIWTNSTGAEGYTVKYGTQTEVYSITLSGNKTSPTTVPDLTANTYFFMVVAQNDAGTTNASPEVSATVSPGGLDIAPPSVDLLVAGEQQFTGVGGTGPYTYSTPVGQGTVDADGLFKRAWVSGTTSVTVTDSAFATADASILLKPGAVQLGGGSTTYTHPRPGFRRDASGNLFILGSSSGNLGLNGSLGYRLDGQRGNQDGFFASYDVNGKQRYLSQFGANGATVSPSEFVAGQSEVHFVAGTVLGDLVATAMTGSAGLKNAFVAAYDSAGAQTFLHRLGGGGSSEIEVPRSKGLVVTSSNGTFLCAHSDGASLDLGNPTSNRPGLIDALIYKLLPNGNSDFKHLIGAGGTNNTTVKACHLNSSGDAVLMVGETTGFMGGTFDDRSDKDMFLARFRADGSFSEDDDITQLGADNRGEVNVSSSFIDGTNAIFIYGDADGDIHSSKVGNGEQDAFVVKFNSSLNRVWSVQRGGDEAGSLTRPLYNGVQKVGSFVYVVGTTTGTVGAYPSGYFKGTKNVFVMKLSESTGSVVWEKSFGQLSSVTTGLSFTVDDTGNVYVYGETDGAIGTNAQGRSGRAKSRIGALDVFLMKLGASTGALVWAVQAGATGAVTRGITEETDTGVRDLLALGDYIYFHGDSDGNLGGTVAGVAGNKRFLARIKKDGTDYSVTQYGGGAFSGEFGGLLVDAGAKRAAPYLFSLSNTPHLFTDASLNGAAGTYNLMLLKFSTTLVRQ